MYYVYALKSISNNYIYVGLTNNIDSRFNRHNIGGEKTTKFYKPFKTLFLTTAEDRPNARLIEIYLKSGIGKVFLKTLL